MTPSEILEAAAAKIESGHMARCGVQCQKGTDYRNDHLARRGKPAYIPLLDPKKVAISEAIGGSGCNLESSDAHNFVWAIDPSEEEARPIHWSEVAAIDFSDVAALLREAAALARDCGEEWSLAALDRFPGHPYHRCLETA